MLLQITNNCEEHCEHCLQCSQEESEGLQHMTKNVFLKSLDFAKKINTKVVAVSGGEPTLNPEWYDFIKYLNFDAKIPFTLITNGTWIENDEIVDKVKKLMNFDLCAGVQVTSTKRYYKSYDKIVANKNKFESLGRRMFLEIDVPIYMEDLGRARTSEKAQEDIKNNPYHMSCLNACLAFKQLNYIKDIGPVLLNAKQLCKPCVDWQGNIHLSESWLCPSVGSVYDTPNMIWAKAKKFKPCLSCKNSKKFMESEREDIVKARKIIFG